MKYLISIVSVILISSVGHAQTMETAYNAVSNMGVGWNLGNTLDAHAQRVHNPNDGAYWNGQGLESENSWGQPYTTKELIAMLKDAGYGAIRVPVTWYNHMDKDGKIDAEWMKRVRTVVDYVIDNGLYCILNVHHDTGADNNNMTTWIKADMDSYNSNKSRFEYLWTQIANVFKDYDGHLLFEGYNEMLDVKSSWCYASMNVTGGYNTTIAASAYDAINCYAQSFVDAVRKTGGNNTTRNLIVTTYAASCGTGTWNYHLQDPLKNMKMPTDNFSGHIIFEVHSYPQLVNTNNGVTTTRSIEELQREIDSTINNLKTYLAAKGGPVIIGEWGTSNVDAGSGRTDYDLRRELMLKFVDYYVRKTKEAGIGTFYWMGLTDGLYRSMPAFNQPDLAECIVKAYHGDSFSGKYPTASKMASFLCFEGEKQFNWGDGLNIPADILKYMSEKVELELTYTQLNNQDIIQFYLADWSDKISFMVDNKTFNSDFTPHSHYGSAAGTTHTTVISFDKSTYTKLASKGLIIHGTNVTLRKALLRNPEESGGGSAGIEQVATRLATDDARYNLSGQRTNSHANGIYIVGGKKIIYNR